MFGLGFACDEDGGGSTGPRSTDNIIATSTGQVANSTAGIANNFTSRRTDYASPQGDISNLRTIDFAVQVAAPVAAVDAHSVKRYCEYPAGVFHQVLWGGATTRAMGGANPSVHSSDVIVSSVTGLPLAIPAGSKFWWRTVNVTGSTVTNFPVIARPAGCSALGIDDGNTTSDLGNSGAINPTSTVNSFGPAAVMGTIASGNARAVLILGDSLADGTGDVSGVGVKNGSGWISRGLDPLYSKCKLSKGGMAAAQMAVASTSLNNFLAALGYTDVICEHGINDLSQNSRTPAQILADQQTIYSRLSSSARIWQTTMTARSTSTDGYATVANQTPKTDGTYGQVNSLNALIRAKPAPLYGVIEAADFNMSARDSVVHGGPFPPTSDGTHFASAKAADMATSVAGAIAL